MNSLRTLLAVAALAALTASTQAGLFSKKGCEASKCCDCAPTFQPSCCKPKIVRPRCLNVFNFQRTCAKPLNCDSCVSDGCCMTPDCETTPVCAVPSRCCDSGCGLHGCAPTCAAPCDVNCCDSGCCEATCAAPCDNGCCNTDVCCNTATTCDSGVCCLEDACCESTCCNEDAYKVAELIHKSQTACYAVDRRRAIHKLGDRYDCVCHPEIMSAFIYALNDADERVRAKSADEIGDQLRKNRCCCNQCVVSALTRALADCDRKVRREAEQALMICGYEIVDACEAICCDTACAPTGMMQEITPAAPMPATEVPAPMSDDVPAPAPPAEAQTAYHADQIPDGSARPNSSKTGLTKIFGFLR